MGEDDAPRDFAERVADGVRVFYDGKDPYAQGTVVTQIGSEPNEHVVVVYTVPYLRHPLGLRIRVYPQCPLDDEALRICEENLGEPIGSFYETLAFDGDGVGWWSGDPVEWFYESGV